MEGASIALSGASPDTGWHISGWTGTTNNSSTAANNTVNMPASAHSAGVVYTQAVCIAPVLNISRLNSSTVRLSWTTAEPGPVSGYNLYRSETPYFDPVGVPYQVFANSVTSFDDAVLGNPATNYFYAVRAVCTGADPALSEASGQVGKFEFELSETTDTDYTWITIPLVSPSLTMASDLATHIQNNSNAAVEVITVSNWNSSAQSIEPYFINLTGVTFQLQLYSPTEWRSIYRARTRGLSYGRWLVLCLQLPTISTRW